MNREAWLTELAKQLEPLYKGFKLGTYRVTCGWPVHKALGVRSRVIGECFDARWSAAGHSHIFISPLLDDPPEVAGVLAHEMAHIAAGPDAKHGPQYVRVCKHVGLTRGKPTVAMPGQLLGAHIAKLLVKHGAYPHTKLVPVTKAVKSKSDVRLLCPACGCRVTISLKWLAESGTPVCGCGEDFGLAPPSSRSMV